MQLGAGAHATEAHRSAWEQVPAKRGDRSGDRFDATEAALEAELARARSDRRWVDASFIAEDLAAYRTSRGNAPVMGSRDV